MPKKIAKQFSRFAASIVLFLFGLIAVGHAQNPPRPKPPAILLYSAPSANELVEFKDPRGVFKMVFPGKTVAKMVNVEQADIYEYSVTRNGASAALKIFEFKTLPTKTDEEMAVIVRAFVSLGGKREITSELVVEIGKRKFWEFEAEGDLRFVRVRALRDGRRVIFLESDVTNWPTLKSSFPKLVSDFERETARFFDSFVLLDSYVPPKPLTVAVYGQVEPGRYVNKFLGFSIDFPEKWYVFAADEIERAAANGLKKFETKNSEVNRRIEADVKKEIILLTVSSGSAATQNGSKIVISTIPSNHPAEDVVEFAGPTRTVLFNNPNFSDVSLARSIDLKGRKFAVVNFVGRSGVAEVRQRLYFTLKDGFAIVFLLASHNKDEDALLLEALESLKFDPK